MLKYRVSSKDLLEAASSKSNSVEIETVEMHSTFGVSRASSCSPEVISDRKSKIMSPAITASFEDPVRGSLPILVHSPQINIYATPVQDINTSCKKMDATYQSMDPREEGDFDINFLGLSATKNTGLLLSPHIFQPSPLDRSSILRTPTKTSNYSMWTTLNNIEYLGSLMSLVMNSETFISFPLFFIHWRVQGLIIYLIILSILGLPIFLIEATRGITADSCKKIYQTPHILILGVAIRTANLFLSAKTCALVGYSLLYAFNAFSTPLPWMRCYESWGADEQCKSSFENQHVHNQSSACFLYMRNKDCRNLQQPSHIQYWEKYVLKWHHHGLRVLGELGLPSTNLLLLALSIWIVIAFIMLVFRNNLSKLVSACSFILVLIGFSISIRNLLESDVLWLLEEIFSINDDLVFDDISCWTEATFLVIAGTSLFNGNIETYTSLCKVRSNLNMICISVFICHIVFLVICILSTMPLLPDDLDVNHIITKQAFGYFPLVLVSPKFSEFEGGGYVGFLFYLGVSVLGLNLLLANTVNLSRLLSCLTNRRYELTTALTISFSGFLLTLPLVYETGPSLLPLYDAYGFKIPVLLLGDILMISICSDLLLNRRHLYDGGETFNWALPFFSKLGSLILTVVVIALFFIPPTVPEPAPLPLWAFHIGMFLSSCSVGQVCLSWSVYGLQCMYERIRS